MSKLKTITKEELQEICNNNYSKSGVARELGLKPSSGNIVTITKKIKVFNITAFLRFFR
jgi:hypothetical protein